MRFGTLTFLGLNFAFVVEIAAVSYKQERRFGTALLQGRHQLGGLIKTSPTNDRIDNQKSISIFDAVRVATLFKLNDVTRVQKLAGKMITLVLIIIWLEQKLFHWIRNFCAQNIIVLLM